MISIQESKMNILNKTRFKLNPFGITSKEYEYRRIIKKSYPNIEKYFPNFFINFPSILQLDKNKLETFDQNMKVLDKFKVNLNDIKIEQIIHLFNHNKNYDSSSNENVLKKNNEFNHIIILENNLNNIITNKLESELLYIVLNSPEISVRELTQKDIGDILDKLSYQRTQQNHKKLYLKCLLMDPDNYDSIYKTSDKLSHVEKYQIEEVLMFLRTSPFYFTFNEAVKFLILRIWFIKIFSNDKSIHVFNENVKVVKNYIDNTADVMQKILLTNPNMLTYGCRNTSNGNLNDYISVMCKLLSLESKLCFWFLLKYRHIFSIRNNLDNIVDRWNFITKLNITLEDSFSNKKLWFTPLSILNQKLSMIKCYNPSATTDYILINLTCQDKYFLRDLF